MDYSALTNSDFNNPQHDIYKLIEDPSLLSDDEYDKHIEGCINRVRELRESGDNDSPVAFKLNSELAHDKRTEALEWYVQSPEELLSPEYIGRIFSIELPPERIRAMQAAERQAAKLKCKTNFNKMCKAYEERITKEKAAKTSGERRAAMLDKYNQIHPNEQVTELPPYIYSEVKSGETVFKISCPLLAVYFRENYRYFWLGTNGNGKPLRYIYRNGVYKVISDDELKGIIKHCITDYDDTLLVMRDVDEVFKNLCCDSVFHSVEELDADENIINFENGLLYLDTMELKPHSPEVLSTIQIACKWNTETTSATVFDSYMETLTNGDKEVRRFLIQFIGAIISNVRGHRMKSALFLVGDGNTGKSQLKSLVEKLIGERNCSPCNLKELEERFGTSAIYGKRLVGSGDMSFMTVKELKTFKSITGGDNVPVEFKGRDSFQYVYKGLVWFCANQLPKFGGDRGDHVYDRMICVRCKNVIPKEKQDRQLLDKMYAEREAIVKAAVLAFKDILDKNSGFDIPEACRLEKERYKVENSPALTFYERYCRKSCNHPDRSRCSAVHNSFREWCKQYNGGYTQSAQEFRKELAAYLTNGDVKALEIVKDGYRYYTFELSKEAAVYIYD